MGDRICQACRDGRHRYCADAVQPTGTMMCECSHADHANHYSSDGQLLRLGQQLHEDEVSDLDQALAAVWMAEKVPEFLAARTVVLTHLAAHQADAWDAAILAVHEAYEDREPDPSGYARQHNPYRVEPTPEIANQEGVPDADSAESASQPAVLHQHGGHRARPAGHRDPDRGDHGPPVVELPGRDGQTGPGDTPPDGPPDRPEGPAGEPADLEAVSAPAPNLGLSDDDLLARIRAADEVFDPAPDFQAPPQP